MINQEENLSNSDLLVNTVISQYSSHRDVNKNQTDANIILPTDKGHQNTIRYIDMFVIVLHSLFR